MQHQTEDQRLESELIRAVALYLAIKNYEQNPNMVIIKRAKKFEEFILTGQEKQND